MSETNTRPPLFGRLVIVALGGALYAYPLWSAVGNLVNLPAYYVSQFNIGLDQAPWFLLVLAVAVPVAVFATATLLTWRRGTGTLMLALTTGFAVVCATALSITAFIVDDRLRIVRDFLLNG
jgi:hypothetical protein